MSVFTWSSVSPFLLLLFPLTAGSVEYSQLIVRLGEEATVPCMANSRHQCSSIDWFYFAAGGSKTATLANRGQIGDQSTKLGGLGLTADCSLVIQNVTAQDVGIYTCRESMSQQKERDFQVYLTVVDISEHEQTSKVSLRCSVMENGPCSHEVEWLHVERDGTTLTLQTSHPSCSQAVLTLQPEALSTHQDLLKCRVTHNHSQVQIFNPRPASTGEDTLKPTTDAALQQCRCSALDYIVIVLHLAELFLVTFIAFLFFRSRGINKVTGKSVLNSESRQTVNHIQPDVESTSHNEDDCPGDYMNFKSPASSANFSVQHEHQI
ncbi:uncharacterized protein LOC103146764 isoform X1 [Poecilia formosa]|uniref:uncharacterized protein LOC103146764 isoform X1 n=1 Tax=Poecilia formosa TaxID=48698 RepID=UPI0007B8B07D|nr:PREDICTED: uncharacterized protein LOC103146764 isoform X1 [Poecilia formosa]